MPTTSYASWVTLYLATKLNPAGTLTVTSHPWPDNGRLYLVNDNQVEWIDYTSVTASWSNYILWWLTRDLSPTTIPATSLSTWKTWLATQKVILVAMHDQIWDRQQGWPFASKTTAELTARTNKLVWETFFDTTLWSLVYYNGSSYQSFWTWTFTNATTTSSWWVEIATQWEVDAWTDTWSVWPLVITPDTYIVNRNAYITSLIPSQAEAEAWSSNTKLSTPLRVKNYVDYINFLSPFTFDIWSDWDVIVTTTVTLTRDMYYKNLTINSGWILNPNWYRVFVDWVLTINSWWYIRRNWNNWSNWVASTTSWPTSWWAWGVALNQWSLVWEIAWSAGWGSSAGVWSAWTVWTASNPSYHNVNGSGWWTWSASAVPNAWWIGWTWWVSTRWANYNIFNSIIAILRALSAWTTLNNATLYKWLWSAWWGWAGGGWSGWTFTWWTGGGWWGNWGIIFISVKEFINNWAIESIWWNGWIWWAWSTNNWCWGGGGWGSWGVVIIHYWTITTLWTITVSWWSGGAWWTWWLTNWTAWTTWATWVVIQIQA